MALNFGDNILLLQCLQFHHIQIMLTIPDHVRPLVFCRLLSEIDIPLIPIQLSMGIQIPLVLSFKWCPISIRTFVLLALSIA
jgi:hypothetical protein